MALHGGRTRVCSRLGSALLAALAPTFSLACSAASSDAPANGTQSAAGSTSPGGNGGSTTGGAGTSSSSGGMMAGGTGGSTAGGAGGSVAQAGTANGGSGPFVPPVCNAGTTTLPAGSPTLQEGTWTNISPAGLPFDSNATTFTQGMTIDPCNPATLYVCVHGQNNGLYRSTDAGSNWSEIGAFGGCINVRVDPQDSLHLYVGCGVVGGTDGFWVSEDGGETWTMPAGFKQKAQEVSVFDVYHVEPNPADFSHVLVTFHNYWTGTDGLAGVFESFDAGDTWAVRQPVEGWNWAGGYNALFLYNPALGIGDEKTWLYGTQGKGYWRTTDSGETWNKVSDVSMQHGGATVYYAPDGTLYASGTPHLIKSTNNGETWTEVGPYNSYLSVIGDGTRLFSGNHGGGHFVTASLGADTSWNDFNSQTFYEGPFQMELDAANSILYSANIRHGVWALKLSP